MTRRLAGRGLARRGAHADHAAREVARAFRAGELGDAEVKRDELLNRVAGRAQGVVHADDAGGDGAEKARQGQAHAVGFLERKGPERGDEGDLFQEVLPGVEPELDHARSRAVMAVGPEPDRLLAPAIARHGRSVPLHDPHVLAPVGIGPGHLGDEVLNVPPRDRGNVPFQVRPRGGQALRRGSGGVVARPPRGLARAPQDGRAALERQVRHELRQVRRVHHGEGHGQVAQLARGRGEGRAVRVRALRQTGDVAEDGLDHARRDLDHGAGPVKVRIHAVHVRPQFVRPEAGVEQGRDAVKGDRGAVPAELRRVGVVVAVDGVDRRGQSVVVLDIRQAPALVGVVAELLAEALDLQDRGRGGDTGDGDIALAEGVDRLARLVRGGDRGDGVGRPDGRGPDLAARDDGRPEGDLLLVRVVAVNLPRPHILTVVEEDVIALVGVLGVGRQIGVLEGG